MKQPWQQQQQQMRRRQEQLRKQQMGAAWQDQKRRKQRKMQRRQMSTTDLGQQSQLGQAPGLPAGYAIAKRPSCIGRLVRVFVLLLVVLVVLFLVTTCLGIILGNPFSV